MWILITKKQLVLCGLCLCCACGVGALLFQGNVAYIQTFASGEVAQPVVIIDPGHGGVDGGAVASDGTVESNLNLEIATKLQMTLRFVGVSCVMTREDDRSLHLDTATTIREMKVSDLEQRVAFVNEFPDAVLLSIHQNSLPSAPSTQGAQCFYNTISGADILADGMQAVLNQCVNNKEKAIKAIPDSIYLMKHSALPSVIVECGFLSNDEETQRLKTTSHQQLLALSIASGYIISEVTS